MSDEQSDENVMVLPGRETIEAYLSQGGFICLKQPFSSAGGDSNIISMLPTDIPIIISWLQQLKDEYYESED